MKLGRCKDCKRLKLLTKHSEIGGHKEGHGWIFVCRECHNLRHGIVAKKRTKTGKYAPGTPKHKKK